MLHALKDSTNFGISLVDSVELIRLPCFSEMLCKSSFAPVTKWCSNIIYIEQNHTRKNEKVIKIIIKKNLKPRNNIRLINRCSTSFFFLQDQFNQA